MIMENNSETPQISKSVKVASQIVSDVFVPLLVPTYGMAVAMWLTSLRTLPENNRLYVTIFVAVLTGVIPMAYIFAMQRMGKISDNAISNRSQRPWPMLVTMLCYFVTAFLLGRMRAPGWLQLFFFGAALATLIAAVITTFWKISAHATSIGGFVGLLLWLAVAGIADVNAMVLITVGIVIAGAVCTARLVLGRHTLGQVTAGFFLGLLSTFGLNILILM